MEISDYIKKQVKKGNYNCLEEKVLEHPMNKELLYYSTLLYEQEQQFIADATTQEKHLHYWSKLRGGGYRQFANTYKNSKFHIMGWPGAGLNIECTTYCCAKCTNCTHERLINTGERRRKHMDLDLLKYTIKKFRLLTLLNGVREENINVFPTGLGEPLCYPYIEEAIAYINIFFKKICFTTNAFFLTEDRTEKLAALNLKEITFSLSYFNETIYEQQIKMNYQRVLNNISRFFEIKRDMGCHTKAIVHIFDNKFNTKEDREAFSQYFSKLMDKQDVLEIRPYADYEENGIEATWRKRKLLHACKYMWTQIMVDVDGNIWPCCSGVWKKHDPYLCLGKITDSIFEINKKALRLRAKHFNKDYGSCIGCPNMFRPENKLPWQVRLIPHKTKEYIRKGTV